MTGRTVNNDATLLCLLLGYMLKSVLQQFINIVSWETNTFSPISLFRYLLITKYSGKRIHTK